MSTIKRFEDLDCWREARVLVKKVYELTNNKKFAGDFELKNQIRRSAVSTMANTAEGFHRNSNKDFMKFLDYSRSSIAETLSHAYVALDQDYIVEFEMETLKQQAVLVWKKINSLISYLNKNQSRNKVMELFFVVPGAASFHEPIKEFTHYDGRGYSLGLSARRVQWWIRLCAQRFAQQVLDRFIYPCQGKWL